MPLILAILITISLCFISSASGGTDGYYWQKQLVFATVGFMAYWGASRIHYNFYLSIAHWVYYLSLILLIVLLLPGVSRSGGWGAGRWIQLGPWITFQPAELAKLGTLLMACSILARSKVGSFRESLIALLKVAVAVVIPFILIFAQPDLGSAMVLPPMLLALLYVSNLTVSFFRVVALLVVLLLGVLYFDLSGYVSYVQTNKYSFVDANNRGDYRGLLPLKDYQRNRILAFVVPSLVDPSGTGVSWNQRQSLITVGSGGLIGKGWQEGTQARLGYLPQTVAHNDFIFSVIAEETGFLGATGVLGLYAVLIAMVLRIAWRASDRFGRLLAIGVCAILVTHIFVNIAMTIGLMPIKGIPLPFVSYGGSFLLSAFVLMGMVTSVERFRLSRAT